MPSQSDHYRRLSLNAQMRAAQATDAELKAGFEQLALGWEALANQAEWLEQRYVPLTPLRPANDSLSPPVLQQEQVQPKKDTRNNKRQLGSSL
jgi:hypothetical protein